MDEFGCFFRVNNLEYDSLWLSLALSFVRAGLMLFLIFFVLNLYSWMNFGCFFRVINLEFYSLMSSLARVGKKPFF